MTSAGCFKIRETTAPRIRTDFDVLLQIETVGICGSDLHYFRTGNIGDQVVQYPFVLGHEFVGTVMDFGPAVTSVNHDDRVVVDPAVSCGQCDQCKQGRPHTCRNLKFLGCPGQMAGCLTEQLIMPESCCYPIPPELTTNEAIFIEPLSIGLYAWQLVHDIHINKVAILGVGPIGLSVLLVARQRGVSHIFVTDKVDARLQAAKKLGVYWTANPNESDVVQAASDELDVVFECCGQEDAIREGINLLKPGGFLVIIGIPEAENIQLPIHLLRRKEITILNVRRQNGKMHEAIDFTKQQLSYINTLITHEYRLQNVQEAFEKTSAYEDGVIKAIITIK